MLTTTASRTLSRVAVQRMVAGRAQRTYAVAGGPVNETKPGARPGDNPPAPAGTSPVIYLGAAALAAAGVYFFTRPNDAAQKAGQAEAKLREAGHKAGDAVESLKAAGQEKFEDFKSEASKKASQLEAEAERLKAKGDRKWEEVKRQAENAYADARKETESLTQKAINDAKSLVNQGEAKANEVKAEAEKKKKGWFS